MKKCCYILFFLLLMNLHTVAQKRISLDLDNRPAKEVFSQIAAQSGCFIFYIPSETDSLLITLHCKDELPAVALQQALQSTSFQLSIFENKYLFVLKGKRILTELPDDYFQRRNQTEVGYSDLLLSKQQDRKATSENKLYVVGNEKQTNPGGKVKLSGYITDFRTGEPIPGVAVYTEQPSVAATTDPSGFYSLQLPAGRLTLLIRGVGLKNARRQVRLLSDGKLDIELEEQVYSLKEVTVTANQIANVQSNILGAERIKIKEIKNIPTAFGETDVIRIVMMLPGVKAVGEASSGFNVRGGATDQNLILFNNGTIYNPTHMFGFFSAFNPDLVKDIELYRSSIPARYGGRISSVLEISSREGNKKKFSGSLNLGLLTSRLTLEGPIGKNTSFIVGGRTTYSDWMLNLLPDKSNYKNGKAGFYDLNLIIDHKFSSNDHLNISGYYSRDRFSFSKNERYGYCNANAAAKWRHVFADRLTSALTAGYDHYDYNSRISIRPLEAYKLSFGINQIFGRLDMTAYLSEQHTLDFGLGTIHYELNPGTYIPDAGESLVLSDQIQRENAFESSVYLTDRWDLSSSFSVNAGLRYTLFNAMGPRTYNQYMEGAYPADDVLKEVVNVDGGSFKTYQAPEFRLSARYIIRPDLSVKAGVNTLNQYIHKLSNTTIMSPTDTWKLCDMNIKPQRGMQVAAGVYKNFAGNTVEASVEGYYKTIKDYLDYRGGARLTMNHHIETDVIRTKGKAYGVEVMFKKIQGKLNGWISYSYSRTLLRQTDFSTPERINHGDWYPADYDKPHELKLAGNYKFTQRFSMSLNCDYSTGRPVTLPVFKYEYAGGEYAFYSSRNQYRIPDFFRMDFAVNIEPSHKLTLLTHSSFTLGIYNLTGRKNPYSVYYTAEKGKLNGYQMAIFGSPIPYISYNIKF